MAERSERVAPFRATHRAPELLAPAGGPDPFNAALAAGADAIYCGLGTDFNARRGARNFDDETFAAALAKAAEDPATTSAPSELIADCTHILASEKTMLCRPAGTPICSMCISTSGWIFNSLKSTCTALSVLHRK